MSSTKPVVVRFAMRVYNNLRLGMGESTAAEPWNKTISHDSVAVSLNMSSRHPSILSDVTALNSLTRSPALNRLIIDTLEGQMITMLVVVAFILIFLIREWVVQQQPGMQIDEFDGNLPLEQNQRRNEDTVGEVVAEPRATADDEQHHETLPLQQQQSDPSHMSQVSHDSDQATSYQSDKSESAQADADSGAELPNDSQAPGGVQARRMARARRRVHFPAPGVEGGESSHLPNSSSPTSEPTGKEYANDLHALQSSVFTFQGGSSSGSSGQSQRPTLPDRDELSRAAEIRRTLEEENRTGGKDWPGLQVFMNYWSRADGNPSNVLEIIRDEDREDELKWIVNAMKRLQASSPTTLQEDGPDGESQFQDRQSSDNFNSQSTESWVDLSHPLGAKFEAVDSPAHSKGKEKATESDSSNEQPEIVDGIEVAEETDSRPTSPASLTDWNIRSEGPRPDVTEFLEETEEPVDETSQDSLEFERKSASSRARDASVGALSDDSNHSHQNMLKDERLETSVSQSQSVTVPTLVHRGGDTDPQPADETHARERPQQQRQQNLLDRVTEWLWGDIAPIRPRNDPVHENVEQVVEDLAAEPPFMAIPHRQQAGEVDRGGVDDAPNAAEVPHAPEMVADGGGLNGNDPDVVEDGEDFDGVMELIGMQGPLTGLFQNAMFSAVLISASVGAGVWIPYIWGKVVVLLLANPVSFFLKIPLRWFAIVTDLFVDLLLFFSGSFIYWTDQVIRLALVPLSTAFPFMTPLLQNNTIAKVSRSVAEQGLSRSLKMIAAASLQFREPDYPVFSAVSHEALQYLQLQASTVLRSGIRVLGYAWHIDGLTAPKELVRGSLSLLTTYRNSAPHLLRVYVLELRRLGSAILKPNSLKIALDIPPRTTPLDISLAHWNSGDRLIAILAGYAFFSVAGAVYTKRGSLFSSSDYGKRIEHSIIEVLQQAGGILKVILIISIEMIVFPLYCGLLLDVALLPLFETATLRSRMLFTWRSPWTSVFIHWFVGTCYMFHFALFVSMCRKIMRSGVLYFIRDPDDPTFHPVRDVLERNVATQLRKIAFSALVYGALVIICLGSVVWGLAYSFEGVLPIHWSSNEPVLEFPVDLLFYNFLMPLMVKFFKPAEGLHYMYTRWFRECARKLRLTWFLFGVRKLDEEGHQVYRTWRQTISGMKGDFESPIRGEVRETHAEDNATDAYFLRDGRYVRVPASDQVRIPKGSPVFVEVDENDEWVIGDVDPNNAPHGREPGLFTRVYVPPMFRLRIAIFVFMIWVFAALTGVLLTIGPLVAGRLAFELLLPNHLRMNDVYAFSIGIYLCCGIFYGVSHRDKVFTWLRGLGSIRTGSHGDTVSPALEYWTRLGSILYTYSAFIILLPSLLAVLMELYMIIPLHTYLAPGETHVIHFMQDWTLGVLYVKVAGRLILWQSESRPAEALRAIVRQGWLNPDARIATRCFVFPATVVMVLAIAGPLVLGLVANSVYFHRESLLVQSQVYRYSYPLSLALCASMGLLYLLALMFASWTQTIRDEVYLIGNRLHNFGESKIISTAKSHAGQGVRAGGGA
ncbi:MAG: hypothetical protein M1833_003529 [Piccolia ochrophora]|nr:MAG: hypothetical protein M1833_003529 [Piccolia ochrophora]